MRHQVSALAGRQWRPVSVDEAGAQFQWHYRCLATFTIQRARHRDRPDGTGVGLSTAQHSMVCRTVYDQPRHINIHALKRLAEHLALGLNKPRVDIALDVLELRHRTLCIKLGDNRALKAP
jgi:hypothetical protein